VLGECPPEVRDRLQAELAKLRQHNWLAMTKPPARRVAERFIETPAALGDLEKSLEEIPEAWPMEPGKP
jgi:hypothetical protein